MSPQNETGGGVSGWDGPAVTAPPYRGGHDQTFGAEGAKEDVGALSKTPFDERAREELNRFYSDLFAELGEFIRKPSATASGAAVVAKRVALAHGLEMAQYLPLPRLTRAELEERRSGAQ